MLLCIFHYDFACTLAASVRIDLKDDHFYSLLDVAELVSGCKFLWKVILLVY